MSVIIPVKFKKQIRAQTPEKCLTRESGLSAAAEGEAPGSRRRAGAAAVSAVLCENYARPLHLGVLLKTSGIVHYHIKRPV